MRQVRNTVTGQNEMVYDHIIADGKTMEYIRAFTMGVLDKERKYTQYREVFETPNGDFVYRDGRLVEKRADLEMIPDKTHKPRALAWFDRQFPDMAKPAGRPRKNPVYAGAENEPEDTNGGKTVPPM